MSKKKHRDRPSPETLGLAPVGIDTHAHLDMRGFEPAEIPDILARARAAGVARIGNVFLGPDAYTRNAALFAAAPQVFFILGMHPTECSGYAEPLTAAMEAAFRADPRLRAVGEIGLDFYWDDAPPEDQKRALREQLEMARGLDAPVVIHSRSAEAETLAILADMGFSGRPLAWHCFGGDTELARRILSLGFFISVPGPVTYAKNTALAAAVAEIPLSRLLLETDAPFLTAEPWRGKRNEPALLGFTAARVADIKGLSPDEVWRATADNAVSFFGLPDLPSPS
ncbi:TatD family hydrolase [Desulfolutivibrio sp.]|uniref:TatD family hydrolase n=1 Tax=Desulfolutivibrio sp. TaxID=2773296 RepID=UPI002F966944